MKVKSYFIILFFFTTCLNTPYIEPDLNKDFSTIEKNTRGKTVTIAMWGGDHTINTFIDNVISPRLKKKYDITLKRIPVSDIRTIINKLHTEKKQKKTKGSIDIIWINGENFKLTRKYNLLYGPFSQKLPNIKYVNDDAKKKDFGLSINNMETPWGQAHFVMVYNSAKTITPPMSLKELEIWVKKNPGQFTYPAPPDFTGSAFIRTLLYSTLPKGTTIFSKKEYQRVIAKSNFWKRLRALRPYMWKKGKTYPPSLASLNNLYQKKIISLTMSYNPASTATNIKKKRFAPSSKTYIFNHGTFTNYHYLAIPFNAYEKNGALSAINHLISVETQILKQSIDLWGDTTVLNLKKIPNNLRKKITTMAKNKSLLSIEYLRKNEIPEMSSSLIELIEEDWKIHVAQKP